MAEFLKGNQVEPLRQGRAAGLHEVETLLTLPADQLRTTLEKVLKETK